MRVPLSHDNRDQEGEDGKRGGGRDAQQQEVFYNPVQVQNRDLSLLMIALHWERSSKRWKELHEKKNGNKKRRMMELQQKQKEQTMDARPSGTQASALKAAKASEEDSETVHDHSSSLPSQLHLPPSTSPPSLPSMPPYRVLDALAASGLRSVRYWKELHGRVSVLVINDVDVSAVRRIHENLALNGLSAYVHNIDGSCAATTDDDEGIQVCQSDALDLLYKNRTARPFSIIDLDPYGSASVFVDAAVQAIRNGGMLCVTCTDMAALGGSHPETCYGRYGSVPLQRSGYLQELALRILLQSIAITAAKYGRTIRPILSVGMDFYVRVWVEVWDDKAGVRDLALKMGHVYQSPRCSSFKVMTSMVLGGKSGRVYQAGRVPSSSSSLCNADADSDMSGGYNGGSCCCPETGVPFKVGGPIWLGPLHDPDVVRAALERLEHTCEEGDNDGDSALSPSAAVAAVVVPDVKLLATRNRLRGLLESCRDELIDVPLYYRLPDLCSSVRMGCLPRRKMEAAIRNLGFRVSGYHKEPQAIKTDAPDRVVWDIIRAWYHLQQQQQEHNRPGFLPSSPGGRSRKKRMKDCAGAVSKDDDAAKGAVVEEGATATETKTTKAITDVAFLILSRPVATANIDFDEKSGAGTGRPWPSSGLPRAPRYPMNPEPFWGPKRRAVGSLGGGRKRKKATASSFLSDEQQPLSAATVGGEEDAQVAQGRPPQQGTAKARDGSSSKETKEAGA